MPNIYIHTYTYIERERERETKREREGFLVVGMNPGSCTCYTTGLPQTYIFPTPPNVMSSCYQRKGKITGP
jgi:hypothetical protein